MPENILFPPEGLTPQPAFSISSLRDAMWHSDVTPSKIFISPWARWPEYCPERRLSPPGSAARNVKYL